MLVKSAVICDSGMSTVINTCLITLKAPYPSGKVVKFHLPRLIVYEIVLSLS